MQLYDIEDLVVVAEFNSPAEAEMAKNMISTAGIYAEVRSGYMANIYPGIVASQLLVGSGDRDLVEVLLRLRD